MFGDRLRCLRKELKLTQKQLGEKLSISARVIGYYETNEHFPDREMLLAISDYFDVSLDYLLCRTDEKKINSNYNAFELDILENVKSLDNENKNKVQEYIMLLNLFEKNKNKYKRKNKESYPL